MRVMRIISVKQQKREGAINGLIFILWAPTHIAKYSKDFIQAPKHNAT